MKKQKNLVKRISLVFVVFILMPFSIAAPGLDRVFTYQSPSDLPANTVYTGDQVQVDKDLSGPYHHHPVQLRIRRRRSQGNRSAPLNTLHTTLV